MLTIFNVDLQRDLIPDFVFVNSLMLQSDIPEFLKVVTTYQDAIDLSARSMQLL